MTRLPSPDPQTSVRRGRLAAAAACLVLGVVCAFTTTAAGLPILQLLPGGTPPTTLVLERHLTAQTAWATLGVGLLVVGNLIVAGEFRRIDWMWPAEELR